MRAAVWIRTQRKTAISHQQNPKPFKSIVGIQLLEKLSYNEQQTTHRTLSSSLGSENELGTLFEEMTRKSLNRSLKNIVGKEDQESTRRKGHSMHIT